MKRIHLALGLFVSLSAAACANEDLADSDEGAYETASGAWSATNTSERSYRIELGPASTGLPDTFQAKGEDLYAGSFSLKKGPKGIVIELGGNVGPGADGDRVFFEMNGDLARQVGEQMKRTSGVKKDIDWGDWTVGSGLFKCSFVARSGYYSCRISLPGKQVAENKGFYQGAFAFAESDPWKWGTAGLKNEPYKAYRSEPTSKGITYRIPGDERFMLSFVEATKGSASKWTELYAGTPISVQFDGAKIIWRLDRERSSRLRSSLLGGRNKAEKMTYGGATIDCTTKIGGRGVTGSADGTCTIMY